MKFAGKYVTEEEVRNALRTSPSRREVIGTLTTRSPNKPKVVAAAVTMPRNPLTVPNHADPLAWIGELEQVAERYYGLSPPVDATEETQARVRGLANDLGKLANPVGSTVDKMHKARSVENQTPLAA